MKVFLCSDDSFIYCLYIGIGEFFLNIIVT